MAVTATLMSPRGLARWGYQRQGQVHRSWHQDHHCHRTWSTESELPEPRRMRRRHWSDLAVVPPVHIHEPLPEPAHTGESAVAATAERLRRTSEATNWEAVNEVRVAILGPAERIGNQLEAIRSGEHGHDSRRLKYPQTAIRINRVRMQASGPRHYARSLQGRSPSLHIVIERKHSERLARDSFRKARESAALLAAFPDSIAPTASLSSSAPRSPRSPMARRFPTNLGKTRNGKETQS